MTWFKNWVFGRRFVIEALSKATQRGSIDAFQKAREDVLETFQGDVEARAKEIATAELSKLLSPIDPSFIVKYSDQMKAVFIGNERAEEGRLSNLKAEAEFFLESELWKLIHETPKELAQQAMFVSGDNAEAQLKAGRSMLFTLATQKKIVDIFLSYKPKA